MSEETLKGIVEAAREQDPANDPRYLARIEGTLSAEDEAELRALAERSEAHRAAWEASEPIGPEKQAAFVKRIPSPNVVWLRPLVVAATLAAAAAVFVLVRPPSPEPLPAYAMVVTGGDQQLRSTPRPAEPNAALRLGPGSLLDITVRPETRSAGDIAVHGYLRRAGTTRRWDAKAEVSKDGAIRIHGDKESLFPGEPKGMMEVLLVIGRPNQMPTDEQVMKGEEGGSFWRAMKRDVVLLDEAVDPRGGAGNAP